MVSPEIHHSHHLTYILHTIISTWSLLKYTIVTTWLTYFIPLFQHGLSWNTPQSPPDLHTSQHYISTILLKHNMLSHGLCTSQCHFNLVSPSIHHSHHLGLYSSLYCFNSVSPLIHYNHHLANTLYSVMPTESLLKYTTALTAQHTPQCYFSLAIYQHRQECIPKPWKNITCFREWT